jgi:hypothetical protein
MRVTGGSRPTFQSGLLTLLLLSGAAPVAAEPVTWEMTGTIDTTSGDSLGELAALFPAGSLACFTLTYDTDAVDSFAWTPNQGVYEYVAPGTNTGLAFNADLAGHQYGLSGLGRPVLRVDPNPASLVVDTSLSGSAVTGALVGTTRLWRPEALDLGLSWANAFADDSLPGFGADGGSGGFTLYLTTSTGRAQVNGSVSSVHAVPEPTSFALVGLGLAGFAAFRRRRSRGASERS